MSLNARFFDNNAHQIKEEWRFSTAFDHTSGNPEFDISRAKIVALIAQDSSDKIHVLVFPPTVKLITIIRTQLSSIVSNQTVFEGFVMVGEREMRIEWGVAAKENDKPSSELQLTIHNEIERLLFGNG